MLFQQGPLETTGFMIFGYVIIFGSMLLYLISLIVRWRNLKRDEILLKELEKEE